MQYKVTRNACVTILLSSLTLLMEGCATDQVGSDSATAAKGVSSAVAKSVDSATKAALPTTQNQPSAPAQALPVIDPTAIQALRDMGQYLRTLKSFKVSSESSIDERLVSGQKVIIDGNSELIVERPNRLYYSRKVDEDLINQQFYYNGKTFTVYGDTLKFYASMPAPATIKELLDVAWNRYGIDIPLSDFFTWGEDPSTEANILAATYVGPTQVNNIPCEHYAFHNADVDWQVWIEKGNKPLPRKLAITTITEEGHPRFVSDLNWTLSPKINEKLFNFVPPKDAHKIDFAVIEKTGEKNK